MKFFLVIMIFALAFGGYSAASHAMGKEDCVSSSSAQSIKCDHANAGFDKDHAQKHEKSVGKCMDCSHCCASSLAIFHTKAVNFSVTATSFLPEASQARQQGRIFSLLRPPRTLA